METTPLIIIGAFALVLFIILCRGYIIKSNREVYLRDNPKNAKDFKLTAPLVWPGSLYVRVIFKLDHLDRATIKGVYLFTRRVNSRDGAMDVFISYNLLNKLDAHQINQLEQILTFYN